MTITTQVGSYPNTGYREGADHLPIPSRYDPSQGNPGGPLPVCPYDGAATYVIGGSGACDVRCIQCSAQWTLVNYLGKTMRAWPKDGREIPLQPNV